MTRISLLISLTFLLGCISLGKSYIVEPGPKVIATRGAIWPKPQNQTYGLNYWGFQPPTFQFKVTQQTCSLLTTALTRYWNLINTSNRSERRVRLSENKRFENRDSKANIGILSELDVQLRQPCQGNEYPALNMDEAYTLTISDSTAQRSVLSSSSIWGILRGLETFSQLIHLANDDFTIIVNATVVTDSPRFSHRGLLLDTSRHFMPLYIIQQTLDAMEYNKYNVFHWHIVDDHSFPYQSTVYPELSNKGAYQPVSMVYTQSDIAGVIEYARVRGIRVMPEFDTPGHTRSWGVGQPNILTPCYANNTPTGQFGPMDPSSPTLYPFLTTLFQEIVKVFPDKYVHLGGDEVGFECWQSNPGVNNYMTQLNISGDYAALESTYIQKLVNIVDGMNASTLVWEEVFNNGVLLPNNTIVQVWIENGYKTEMAKVTLAGKPTLLSACWYLDHLKSGGDWDAFYACDPHDFNGTQAQYNMVWGGEACMWAEVVNENNVVSRVWPRASAPAEKLWSAKDADTYQNAQKRLEEHTCRMNSRGIPAEPPNGPGYCV